MKKDDDDFIARLADSINDEVIEGSDALSNMALHGTANTASHDTILTEHSLREMLEKLKTMKADTPIASGITPFAELMNRPTFSKQHKMHMEYEEPKTNTSTRLKMAMPIVSIPPKMKLMIPVSDGAPAKATPPPPPPPVVEEPKPRVRKMRLD